MGWAGTLTLHYRADTRDGTRHTTATDRHVGPLRVLQALYPEGPGICHHVLVHPPGGLVGGDTLDLTLTLAEHTHAVLTTPGAARFYRSEGEAAAQHVTAHVAPGARLEWLPLETIAYPDCQAANTQQFHLAPGAEMLGWDVLALGLPAAGAPFDRGRYVQRLGIPGLWREEGELRADDRWLMDGPQGLDGRRVVATGWFAVGGGALAGDRLEALREAALPLVDACDASVVEAGLTAPADGLIVLRVLAQRVEPAMRLLAAVRGAWRGVAWGLAAHPPRVWRT